MYISHLSKSSVSSTKGPQVHNIEKENDIPPIPITFARDGDWRRKPTIEKSNQEDFPLFCSTCHSNQLKLPTFHASLNINEDDTDFNGD
jgi:hypothetical protein